MTTDEGGYLAIARAWSRGAGLYRDVWVDRPQGLLVVFRGLVELGVGTPLGVRSMALISCIAASVACGSAAGTLAGARARWITALLAGVLLSVPQYEGFIANSELLGGTAGVIALAVILRAVWERSDPWLTGLFVAGVVAGCAVSMRQSSVDALAAGVVAAAITAYGQGWRRAVVARASVALGAGVLVPIGLIVIHAAVTGWDRWWFAVAGYRLGQRSVLESADWERLGRTYEVVRPVLLPAVVVIGGSSAVVLLHRCGRSALIVLFAWCAFALPAFALGGQFHRHYWVTLMFPLATLAGVLISQLHSRPVRAVLLIALLVTPAVMTWRIATMARDEIPLATSADPRLVKDERVARWFNSHAAPGEQIYVLCYSAGLYGHIDADPPFPYLWGDQIEGVPTAVPRLIDLLSSANPPTFIADYQRADTCDPTGSVGELIAQRYERVTTVDGIPVYQWSARE
jgi:hypothetical protein